MKAKTRLSRWRKKEHFPVPFDEPVDSAIQKIIDKQPKKGENISNVEITQLAREFIFDWKKSQPVFHIITPVFNTKKLLLRYEHSLDLNISGNPDEIEKEVVNTLGLAVAFDIPIFPNRQSVEKKLAYYYQKLLRNGFTAPGKDGKDVRLKPANSKQDEDFTIENITKIDLTRYWSPSDLYIIKNVVSSELQKLNSAQRTLANLEAAISELESELSTQNRNENNLQKCLTNNPILLGVEYIKVIPKHRLGSEYEVDYALVQYSGLIDLMEIESSNLPLFSISGDPSKYLVHAEQQLINWIDWVEKNNSYARAKLEGLLTPKGYIIIGREHSLTDEKRASLVRRNKAFNGVITILTYDDLLKKAKSILQILKRQ